uniref:Uncharacterized protein n=1 Tax=viral metagenome TaxID=1070528 RepID=A0A2V0RI37_9ZZZZ
MSEAKEQQPLLPRPQKDETVDQFIKNELSKVLDDGSPQYPDLINLSADKVFEKMDNDAAYASVVSESNYIDMKAKFMSQKSEGEQGGEGEKPKVEADVAPKKETVSVVPEVTVDALKTVEEAQFVEPLLGDSPEQPAISTGRQRSKIFEPTYRIETRQIYHKVASKATGPFVTSEGTPLDDILSDVSSYDLTKSRMNMYARFICQFVTPCVVQPLSKVEEDVYVPMDSHALQPTTAKSKYLLTVAESGNLIRPIYDVAKQIDAIDPRANDFVERFSRTDDDYFNTEGAFNLSAYPFASRNAAGAMYQEAEAHSFQCSPHRYAVLKCGMGAFKYLFHTLDELRSLDGYRRDSAAELSISRNELGDIDTIDNDSTKVTLYPRFSVGSAYDEIQVQRAANMFFRNEVTNHLGVNELYEGVMARSLDSASASFTHITPGTANFTIMPSPGLTNHRSLSEIGSIPSSAGAEMMRQLGGVLCGGLGTHLSFNMDPRPASALATPLCCAATMLFFDNDMLDTHTLQNLIAGMLSPFYADSELTVQNHEMGGARNDEYRAAPGVRTILSASQIAQRIVAAIRDKNAQEEIRGLLKANYNGNYGPVGSQRAVKTHIINRLTAILQLYSASRIFVDVELQDNFRLFNSNIFGEVPTVLCPFLPRGNVQLEQSILLGTGVHSTSGYVAGGYQMFQNLLSYVELLDFTITKTKSQPLMDSFKASFDNAGGNLHLAKSQAVFTDALFKCIYEKTDILPMEKGRLPRLGQEGVKSVVLPLEGALSFMIHGIGSASVNEESTFIPFERSNITQLPSKYPMYLYLERAITQELHDKVIRVNAELPILFHRTDELVEVVTKSLKRIYASLDPDTEKRVSLMLRRPGTYLVRSRAGARFSIPAELKYPETILNSQALSDDASGLGRVFSRNAAFLEGDTIPPLAGEGAVYAYTPLYRNNVFLHCLEYKSSRTKDIYICINGLDKFYFRDGASITYMMYGVDVDKVVMGQNAVDINDMLENSVHTANYTPSVGSLLAMARRRNAERGEGIAYIKIPQAKASYSLQELSSDAAYVNESSEIKVSTKSYGEFFRYEVDNFPLYFRKSMREYSDLDDNSFGPYNETWIGHLGMSPSHISDELITTEGITEELNANEMFHPRKRAFKLVDGSGFVHSTNMTFTSRDKDEYVIKDKVDTYNPFLLYLPRR